MARIRSVKPEICESETIAQLTAEEERTFVRLWTHLDDDGRCKDDPRLIVAALFPLLDDVTAAVVDGHLRRLAELGLIVRYEVDGIRYLACPSWSEHQHPQRKRDSKLPPPPESDPAPIAEVSRTPPRTDTEDSGPVVVVGEVGVEGGVATNALGQHSAVDPPSTRSAAEAETLANRVIAKVARAAVEADPSVRSPDAVLPKRRQAMLDEFGPELRRRCESGEDEASLVAWLTAPPTVGGSWSPPPPSGPRLPEFDGHPTDAPAADPKRHLAAIRGQEQAS